MRSDVVIHLELFEHISDLYAPSLVWEIALALLGSVAVFLVVAASVRPEHRAFGITGNVALAIIGLGSLGYSIWQLVGTWSSLDLGLLAREFALPIWMTAASLPLLYVVALYASYELPLRGMCRAKATRGARARACVALMAKMRTRRTALGLVNRYWVDQTVTADSVRGGMRILDGMLEEADARAAPAEAEAERLVTFAGVLGADPEGRQLDRREIEETTKALRWLANCHRGHYQKLGRYRPDMLSMIEGPKTFPGLPQDHGIRMTPEGPPRHDPQWGNGPFDLSSAPNW